LRSEALRSRAFARFPILGERRRQTAAQLSGGEQQMLSLAPALVDPPAVFIADEPTLGLAPMIADQIVDALAELRDAGTAILMVDEHVRNAMRVADTLVLMELGTVVWTGPPEDADHGALASAYLGSGAR
jgi:ABC-type branched-subunit amino acid transport system ATPase component